ncbi:hypothetical protein ACP4OV_002392 [Aristida adscensionis]
MEVVLGALQSLLPKLTDLLIGEYNLQKEVKGGIRFLKSELESMQGALEKISETPVDQLDKQDKIWAREVRELSYDIEDKIDIFRVEVLGSEPAKQQGFMNFIDKTIRSLKKPKSQRKIVVDIREIKCRVQEVAKRRDRYKIDSVVAQPIRVDPRALVRYENVTKLVGIDEARDEVIKILMTKGNEVSKQPDKVVSIVGFGGLGKTTLANLVYQELKPKVELFDCSAFLSVSQTPDTDKLLKDMFYQLAGYSTTSINVIVELRKFLEKKRYLIILDDIWHISHWDELRCALPDGIDEYRIITTTRIFKIAEQIGGAYKMKPLSLENSRILMFGRVFGEEGKHRCPNEELVEVSNRILKKCAGVPLAIITISSLLVSKGRNKLEWYDICNSIGTGLEENNTIDNMRKVLSLSYYDIPSYLRTCLLYLSVFPEDYEIAKDRLIWLWVAEGFIQSRKLKNELFEMAESYLNELVNRSLIQPVYDDDTGMIKNCRVHDMVLDLIRSFSSEENFATIDNVVVYTSVSRKIRRLSFQNGKEDHGKHKGTMGTEHVRSVFVFRPTIDLIPTLEKFKVLRVLDLEDYDLSRGHNFKYLKYLFHLRYLGLRNTGINQLPEELGNLQFLQTLDVRRTKISSLPLTIVQLTHLMCLRIQCSTTIPNGIGILTSIEELSKLLITDDSADIIKELGHLTELRVLDITSDAKWNDGWDKSLVECLQKLQKIQSLHIQVKFGECNLDGWVVTAPQHIRILRLSRCWFSVLPAWVNPLLLLDLCLLDIRVRVLKPEGLEILGRLPALRFLSLSVDHEKLDIHERFAIDASWFLCLVRCFLWGFGGPVVFQQGAMSRLTELWLDFHVWETRELNGNFDLGLGNLSSLQNIEVWFGSERASKDEVKEAKDAVVDAIKLHPNHPTLLIYDTE